MSESQAFLPRYVPAKRGSFASALHVIHSIVAVSSAGMSVYFVQAR